MTHRYLLFLKINKILFTPYTFKSFQNKFFKHSWGQIQELFRNLSKKLFFKPTHILKSKQPFWKHNEQVPKSSWRTPDRKGANTFPFYKSTSRTEKHLEEEFCCAFVLSMLENIKDGGDSCLPRHFVNQLKKQSVLFPPITVTIQDSFIIYWGSNHPRFLHCLLR